MDPQSRQLFLGGEGSEQPSWFLHLSGLDDWGSVVGGLYDVSIAADGTIYTTGWGSSCSGAVFCISKDGELNWKKRTDTGIPNVLVNSSGDVFTSGMISISGNTHVQVAKWNSSGVHQWAKSTSYPWYNSAPYGIVEDGSDAVVFATYYGGKFLGSGSLYWSRNHGTLEVITANRETTWGGYDVRGGAGGYPFWGHITSSGIADPTFSKITNFYGYALGPKTPMPANAMVVIANSTNLRWGTTASNHQLAVSHKPNATAYEINAAAPLGYYPIICGPTAASDGAVIVKTAGGFDTIQWQRKLQISSGGTTSNLTPKAIAIDPGGTHFVVVGNAFNGWIARLPLDGSLTGTYTGVIAYANRSLTYSASSYSTTSVSQTISYPCLVGQSSSSTQLTDKSESALTVTSTPSIIEL